MRKNKSTSFKTDDSYEAKLLTWAEADERGDYSKYIKRLISRDMEGLKTSAVHTVTVEGVSKKNEFSGFI